MYIIAGNNFDIRKSRVPVNFKSKVMQLEKLRMIFQAIPTLFD